MMTPADSLLVGAENVAHHDPLTRRDLNDAPGVGRPLELDDEGRRSVFVLLDQDHTKGPQGSTRLHPRVIRGVVQFGALHVLGPRGS